MATTPETASDKNHTTMTGPNSFADLRRAAPLHDEQHRQHRERHGHHRVRELRLDELQPFDRAQHRDGRRDHAVAEEQRRARKRAADEDLRAAARGRQETPLRQREQREHAALAVVVRAHDHDDVFERDRDRSAPRR